MLFELNFQFGISWISKV